MSALAIRRFPERITRRRPGTATFNLYGEPEGAVTVTGWCQLRVASSFLL